MAESDLVGRLRAAGCVYAEEEARLLASAARTSADLEAMVARRVAGEPLEHVLGWAELGGVRVAVEPGVFVPRRRTELLVREAVALLGRDPGRDPPVVVDLCCGAGAVGAAVCAAVHRVELYAVDVDPAAVRLARANLAATGAQVYEGDLDEPLPVTLHGRVDVLVANVPYVPSGEIALLPAEARLHEPRVALDGGTDGLDVFRRVAAVSPRWLAPGGHLLVETSEGQAAAAVRSVRRAGLAARLVRDDALGATVVVGSRPTSRGGARQPPGRRRPGAATR